MLLVVCQLSRDIIGYGEYCNGNCWILSWQYWIKVCVPLGQDARSSLCSVSKSCLQVQYPSGPPTQSISILSDITVMFLHCSDGGNPYQSVRFTSRIVRVFPVLSLDAYGLYTGLFFIVFQPNCARSRLFSHHQFKCSLVLDFDN